MRDLFSVERGHREGIKRARRDKPLSTLFMPSLYPLLNISIL